MSPIIYNLIITLIVVAALYSFSKTKTFYLIRKRIYMFILVRIPCQYFLMEQTFPNGAKVKFLMLLFYVPIIKVAKHAEIEYDLFKKWYPIVLEEVERRMITVPKEEIIENEKVFTEDGEELNE